MQMPLTPCDGLNADECLQNETSIGMLRSVFGTVIDNLVSGADPMAGQQAQEILPSILSWFNSGLVLVGGILILFILGLGVTNSANDGEVFGRNWSPTWTTLRVVFGMGILMPSTAGYSFIQVFVLLVSLWGVGLANGIHKIGIESGLLADTSVTNGVQNAGAYYGMASFAEQYVITSYCARTANYTYAENGAAPHAPNVSFNPGQPDHLRNMGNRVGHVYRVYDRNRQSNLGGGNDVCGALTLFSYNNAETGNASSNDDEGSSDVNRQIAQMRSQVQQLKLAEATQLMGEINEWVGTWPANSDEDGWEAVDPNRFHQIVAASDARLVAALRQQVGAEANTTNAIGTHMQNIRDFLTRGGWADAGGWFQKVGMIRSEIMQVTGQPVGSVTAPALGATDAGDPREQVLERSVHQAQLIMSRAADIQQAPRQNFGNLFQLTMPGIKDLSDLSAAQTRISSQIASSSNSFMSALVSSITGVGTDNTNPAYCVSTNDLGGAMNRMKCVGDLMVLGKIAMDTSIFTAKTGTYAIDAAAGGAKAGLGILPWIGEKFGEGTQAFATALTNWIRDVLINTLEHVADQLSHVAFMFSVVLPSMPYLLFMLVVVGWVLGVLQTVVAVPLWALLHMTPERTFVGSQSQGYLLLLSLFVRPALAMIGLYMGMLLSDPVINYIVRGFFAIRGVVDGGSFSVASYLVEMGTFFWWLQVLSYVLLAAIYMCFTLPQMLPGTVLQWIGGGISDLGESNAVQNVRSQMVLDQRKAPFNALKRPEPKGGRAGAGKAPKDAQPVAPSPSAASSSMINPQGTVPKGPEKDQN